VSLRGQEHLIYVIVISSVVCIYLVLSFFKASTRPLNQTSSSGSASTPRIICKKCCCTFPYGESCTRCTQDAEFKESLIADQQSSTKAPENNVAPNSFEVVEIENDDQPLDVEQLRSYRIAHLTGHDEPTEIPEEVSNDYPRESAKIVVKLEIHRTTVKQDLIKEFQDPSILDKEIEFKLINGRGDIEAGEGIGVAREVYSLFWNEFAISMTIGERERVPFVRHDHFIEEWQSMGRILVKGFTSVDYFPTFLSKASVCFCLFGTEVNDDIFLSSFKRYLSPLEEDLIDHILNSKELPEQMEELLDFLERFQCRSVVKKENVCRLLLEIAKQELVQKPHLMISAWRPILQNYLANYPQFQSIMGVTSLYEELTPTPKKVLNNILCNPSTDAERDALKFLQRFIRGLDHEKIAKFLQFTTGMDVMGTSPLKITFSTSQGFGSRPIAHTCSPLLELPTTYTNFVELREEFENILNQKTIWEIDIV